jgi:uncharacterized protein (DUF58 family)
MTGSLLDAEFLRTLEALRRRLSSDARSGRIGEGPAARRGSGTEFFEHRPYEPGDDLRHLDWAAFARSGSAVTKVYRADEETLLRIVIDASASLGFGTPSKLEVGKRLAAALAYLALATGRRAQLAVARSAPEGRPLERVFAPLRGRRAFAELCRELESVEPRGRANLAMAIDALVARSDRPGMLVVVSDFFDAGPLPTALNRARAGGHDLVLIQVLDALELEPAFEGDLSLEDSETGERLELSVDPAALAAYAERLAGLFEELRGWAKRNSAAYARIATGDDLQQAVRRILQRTRD